MDHKPAAVRLFGALYELERDNIKQRQSEGIEVALNKGVKFGRPKQAITPVFEKVYKEWKANKSLLQKP